MGVRRAIIISLFIAAVASCAIYARLIYAGFDNDASRVVTMVIAHRPYAVFDRSLAVFADELAKRSEGSLALRVVAPTELGLPDADIPRPDVERMMRDGDVQLSSAVVSAFEGEVAGADRLDAPFSFDSYSDIASFLDGDEGQMVLRNVSEATPMEALAFTFSGGFRSLALSDGLVDDLSDIQGMHVRPSGGAASSAALERMGAFPDPAASDAIEFTYTRVAELGSAFHFPAILETKHGVLATMILVDDAFFRSLSAREQMALRDAARAAAVIEREDSIALAARTRESLIESGVRIIEVADDERATLRR